MSAQNMAVNETATQGNEPKTALNVVFGAMTFGKQGKCDLMQL